MPAALMAPSRGYVPTRDNVHMSLIPHLQAFLLNPSLNRMKTV